MILLFVYYKADRSAAVTIRETLTIVEKTMATAFPDIAMRVLKRPEADEAGLETWMESYELTASQLPALRETLDTLTVQLGLPSKRATEVFVDA